jgi:hypothetical protein
VRAAPSHAIAAQSTASVGTLFRANTATTKLVGAFARLYARRAIVHILRPVCCELQRDVAACATPNTFMEVCARARARCALMSVNAPGGSSEMRRSDGECQSTDSTPVDAAIPRGDRSGYDNTDDHVIECVVVHDHAGQ